MARRSRPQARRVRPQLQSLEAKQLLTTFAVTNVADSGTGSLRQALLDANAAGQADGGSTVEEIDFAIPGTGTHTITPATPLPRVTQTIKIDATTQPGYAGTPLVVLDGVDAQSSDGSPVVGLDLQPEAMTLGGAVNGLEIIRFSGSAIVAASYGTTIDHDLIGTDAAGNPDLGNGGYGVRFGIDGSNSVTNCVIANNALLAIGCLNDQPGKPASNGIYTETNNTKTNNDTKATTLVVTTQLGVAPTKPVYYAYHGSTITLTYVVTNTGSIAAHDVDVALNPDLFSHLIAVKSAAVSQGTVDPDTSRTGINALGELPRYASLGTIEPGASATITVTTQVAQTGDATSNTGELSAIASSPQIDYDAEATEGTYTVYANGIVPSLTIATPAGTYDDGYVAFGSQLPLVYTVTNTGTADATNVQIAFRTGVKPLLLVKTISGTTTQGTLSPNFDIDSDDNDVATIGTLAPGASATVTILVQVADSDPGNGEIINAVVTADQDPTTPYYINNALYTLSGSATGLPPATPPNNPVPTPPVDGGGPIDGGGPVNNPPPTTNPGGPTGFEVTPVIATTPTPASPPVIIAPTPADLVVSGTAPDSIHAGSAGLFLMTIRNNGGTTATDAVAALNLGALHAGSFYSILTQGSNGAPARVTPWAGRPGVYLVDLGSLAAGASAVVDVMVIPTTDAPLTLVMAASDAAAPTLDPAPDDNVVYLGSTGTATATVTTPMTTATMAAPGVVMVATTTAVTRAEAENLANYRLSTTTGDESNSVKTIKLRSAAYNATTHRVTLRLAHPLPSSVTQAQLTVTGLGSTGTTTLSLARHRSGR